MKINLFKKVTAAVLSLTMVVGMTGVVSAAHAANGENIATQKWTSFSVCTREDGGVWEDALKALRSDAYPNGQVKGTDYATEGWLDPTDLSSSNFRFWAQSTGWDGEYNLYTGDLVGDNPWGMTATMTDIPIEKGRTYTISFKIKSTLKGTKQIKDENGNVTETQPINTKHILFKAYRPTKAGDDPGIDFSSCVGDGIDVTEGGYITLVNGQDYKTVTATVSVPNTRDYDSNYMGIKFAFGALIKTYPDESNLQGSIYVTDFKILAGTQYTVKYTYGGKTTTVYVNAGEKAPAQSFQRKGYTMTGFQNKATGATYNMNSAVTSDVELVPIWTKTKKPAKANVKKLKAAKKKVTVTLKKVKNAVGYQVQYGTNKKFKKAKTKNTTKLKVTIKKLKSGKNVYVRAKAYVLDSAGNKVFGKYSKRKKAFVK